MTAYLSLQHLQYKSLQKVFFFKTLFNKLVKKKITDIGKFEKQLSREVTSFKNQNLKESPRTQILRSDALDLSSQKTSKTQKGRFVRAF